ncbi:MerR family transcriptional regulator [Leucobacter sp. HY1910]
MHHTIQQVAKAAGTTARTLRHYDQLGLVTPSHIGTNGYRYYDDRALVRLQRVLLLRDLGLGLGAIGEVLEAQDAGGEGPVAEARILRTHLTLLHAEAARLATQIASVERTIAALAPAGQTTATQTEQEHTIMTENIFDGFDHTQHRDEVERRWGADAYARSASWWESQTTEEQESMQDRVHALNTDWSALAREGASPDSAVARALATRHLDWLRSVPGIPADFEGYVRGLADMYVQDERFAANYGGTAGAEFVRAALLAHLDAG